MTETLERDGAPQKPEGSERYSRMYLGLIGKVNDRLEEIPEDARAQIEFVYFDLAGDDRTSMTGLTVGRRTQKGVLPLTFHEGNYTETVELERDGSTRGPDSDSVMFATFGADLERRLATLDTAPARGRVILDIPLGPFGS